MRKNSFIFSFVTANCSPTYSSFVFLIKIKYFALVKTIFPELLQISPLAQLK